MKRGAFCTFSVSKLSTYHRTHAQKLCQFSYFQHVSKKGRSYSQRRIKEPGGGGGGCRKSSESQPADFANQISELRWKRGAAGYESRKIMAHLSENPSECSVRPAANRTKISLWFCGLRQCHVHSALYSGQHPGLGLYRPTEVKCFVLLVWKKKESKTETRTNEEETGKGLWINDHVPPTRKVCCQPDTPPSDHPWVRLTLVSCLTCVCDKADSLFERRLACDPLCWQSRWAS